MAASRLASEPAGSLIRMIRVRRDSCAVNPKNSALCELFTSDLRCDVCNVRARGVKDVVTAFSNRCGDSTGGEPSANDCDPQLIQEEDAPPHA
jgi:hypothetical protein